MFWRLFLELFKLKLFWYIKLVSFLSSFSSRLLQNFKFPNQFVIPLQHISKKPSCSFCSFCSLCISWFCLCSFYIICPRGFCSLFDWMFCFLCRWLYPCCRFLTNKSLSLLPPALIGFIYDLSVIIFDLTIGNVLFPVVLIALYFVFNDKVGIVLNFVVRIKVAFIWYLLLACALSL